MVLVGFSIVAFVFHDIRSKELQIDKLINSKKVIVNNDTKIVKETHKESNEMPSAPYMVYCDVGIAPGDVWFWPKCLLWDNVNGKYAIADAPEGKTCFLIKSDSGHGDFLGWGVFLGDFDENHTLKKPNTVDLSDYKNLVFWVKTPINLKVEIQQNNPLGKKSSSCLISNYGWKSTKSDIWQEITIPKSAFKNVDLTNIFCPFMITGNASEATFYVDEVLWVTDGYVHRKILRESSP